jgi:hypothetical protein
LTIQEAIDAANQEGDVIFIAEGEYHVDDGVTTLPSEPSTLTFELKPGIRWEGGYPTGGGTADPVSHPVVLHGSIALSGGGTDFAFHVVTADDPSSSPDLSSLSGLTITKGRANGGGADSDGGGVYAPGRTPAITQCRIVGCQATSSTSNEGRGGGLFLTTGDLITIRQTEFIDNRGTDSGGTGRYPDDSDPTPPPTSPSSCRASAAISAPAAAPAAACSAWPAASSTLSTPTSWTTRATPSATRGRAAAA